MGRAGDVLYAAVNVACCNPVATRPVT